MTVTPDEGYQVKDVTVNGESKGAVMEVTGLKTGDVIVVSFEKTEETVKAEAKEAAAAMTLVDRSEYTEKKNVKVTCTADVSEFEKQGFTVKYKFYRSEKKNSGYVAMLEKDTNVYTNTIGEKGTKYYYKTRVMVYDGDELVAKTELKQCRYATRTWSK